MITLLAKYQGLSLLSFVTLAQNDSSTLYIFLEIVFCIIFTSISFNDLKNVYLLKHFEQLSFGNNSRLFPVNLDVIVTLFPK